MKTTSQIGQNAEKQAALFLKKHKIEIIAQNYRCKTGEIDLIALDNKELVFIEVKYRSNANFGQPYESVDYRKQQKIINAAQMFLQQNATLANKPCRFDIISIHNSEITWLKNAFET